MADSQTTVGPASRGDVKEAVALIDAVFVAPRGRALSFRSCFPSVYSDPDGAGLVVAREGGAVVGVTATRLRVWSCRGRDVRLGAVGGVCVAPESRGRGIATTLMRRAELLLRERGAELGVLWTQIPAFYAGLGWRSKDAGVFGRLTGPENTGRVPVVHEGVTRASIARMEAIRKKQGGACIERVEMDYATLPPPAEATVCLTAGSGNGEAYALAGVAGGAAYVYEIVGADEQFGPLLAKLSVLYDPVYVNAHPAGDFYRWERKRSLVDWKPQNLAMWKLWSTTLGWDDADVDGLSLIDRL